MYFQVKFILCCIVSTYVHVKENLAFLKQPIQLVTQESQAYSIQIPVHFTSLLKSTEISLTLFVCIN